MLTYQFSANLVHQMQTYTRFNKGTLSTEFPKIAELHVKFRTFYMFIEISGQWSPQEKKFFPTIESAVWSVS